MKHISWFILLFLIVSCNSLREKNKGKVVAKVKDQYLYEADIAEIIPGNATDDEKNKISTGFITSWIKEQLIYQEAAAGLSTAQLNKEKELQDYYRSLVRYDYERMFLEKKLDSIVTEQEISAYYQENRKNFELKRNIIRLLYVKVPLDAPDIDKPGKWMRMQNINDMQKLNRYAEDYATNFSLDTSVWFYFDDIKKEVPIIEAYDPEHFIRNNKNVELRDANYIYLINIIDNRIRDEISPLALEKEKIKQIILNKRQVQLIQELENKIYRKGMEQNLFEIYN